MTRILITGATGSLGRVLHRRAAAAGWTATGTYLTRAGQGATERLDIRDPADVRRVLRETRPDVVVHTASGRDRADWAATADGAANVAVAAAAQGVRLVHVSTAALFSGRDVHYDEDALPDPVYPYGAAKAAAETAVRAIAPGAAVIRTSLIVGDGYGGHEQLTRDLIAGRVRGALFTDEIRTPVHVDDLAAALLEIAASDLRGVLNVAGADPVSRYDLGFWWPAGRVSTRRRRVRRAGRPTCGWSPTVPRRCSPPGCAGCTSSWRPEIRCRRPAAIPILVRPNGKRESMRTIRVTVRGYFDGLSAEQTSRLAAGQAEHDFLHTAYTAEGYLAYDVPARPFFTFRFAEQAAEEKDIPAATGRAQAKAGRLDGPGLPKLRRSAK
jgi:dTDP-4-dehydrorhamnose reductase